MAKRENYIITFGQKDKERRDGWVLLKNARDMEQARSFAFSTFGAEFSLMYREIDFNEGYFPKGCLEEFDLAVWQDKLI